MPELPEVEVSRQGIRPHITGQTISKVVIRQPQLRWPVPDAIHESEGQVITDVTRRAKYLFLHTDSGQIILHLGMTGKLRVVPVSSEVKKHDHIEIQLANGQCLRMNDSRRFGACLWHQQGNDVPDLLKNLGPEPLTDEFDGAHLHQLAKGKSQAVKTFIMDNRVVVGVGNIYANESLYRAGIDPRRAAGKVSKVRFVSLAGHIKDVLASAIEQGGTTLRDFIQVDGNPGYFAQRLDVYGRAGKPCKQCQQPIKSVMLGQRNTFYCNQCQR